MNQRDEVSQSRRLPARAQWLIGIGPLVLLITVVLALGPQIREAVSSPEALAKMVRDAGVSGALFMVGLQALQVIIAPIPGQVVNFVAGYVYGFPLGMLLSWLGTVLGAALAMTLARFLGRPVVERLVSPSFLARADALMAEKGLGFFFLAFLIPLLPDDAICLVAGLTPLPLSALIVAAAVGRLPALAASVWMGAHAGMLPPSVLIAGAVATLVLLVLAWRYGEKIEAAMLEFVGRIKAL
jgi:uncharacterized membrane protein YdjX (TVP38/TMEM64 family)